MGKVRCTQSGYLYFDFYYKGERCREHTELKDTPENQKLMNDALGKIEGEIRLGTFSYAKYFPGSFNAQKFKDEPGPKHGVMFVDRNNALRQFIQLKCLIKPDHPYYRETESILNNPTGRVVERQIVQKNAVGRFQTASSMN